MVCNNGKGCAKARPPPSRAHIRGLSADNAGVLVLFEHVGNKVDGATHGVFFVLDAASSLRFAYVQSMLECVWMLGHLRKSVGDMKCKPKAGVASIAFRIGDLEIVYVDPWLKYIATGARPPIGHT